ncbi:hypothetical protein PMAYCL1PPCAC_14039, partial [Pristionchus mayeri]
HFQASILSVLIISLIPYHVDQDGYRTPVFHLAYAAYAENMLNLSIAAVFPICTLFMSREMKRDTGKHVPLLILEAVLGTLVAASNIIVIVVLIAGARTLMKTFQNTFYIVVANIMVFTSLKAFVELGFILPYYLMQNIGKEAVKSLYFQYPYEFAIFSLSVLADYGLCS